MPLPIREPRWLPRARSFKGLREIRGKSHAPAILSFFRDAGFPGIRQDEVPWCAAFANAVLAREGLAGTRSLLARSFLGWGEALDGPAIGALCVLRRGTSANRKSVV